MKQNFRTLATILAAATIAIFAASCKKDYLDVTDLQITGVKRTINTTAAMPQGGDKAYLDYDDNRKVKWELTDALNINGTNIALSSLNADPTRAQFSGTAYAIPSGGNDIYWAVYPTTIVGAASGSTIPSNFTASSLTVTLPDTQTYDASVNALSGNTLMAGYASVPNGEEQIVFQMRNLGAVLKLHLTADASANNKRASRIEFSTTNGALAGDFTVDNSATPTVTPAAGAPQTLTVILTDGTNNYIDITSGADIYVILPPMASKNLTMSVYNTDDCKSTKSVSSATLARNNIYTNTVSNIAFEKRDYFGPFSVAADRQVYLAPGNLQWSATGGGTTPTTHTVAGGGTAPGTWRFAEKQWHIIGYDNSNVSSSYSGWIDLFGWATSGFGGYQPYLVSLQDQDYLPAPQDLAGTNYDWGVYNTPSLPKGRGNAVWRTLTASEWDVLLTSRSTTTIVNGVSAARYTMAYLDTNSANGNTYTAANKLFGIILFPDNAGTLTLSGNGSQWGDINVDGFGYATPPTLSTVSYSDWIMLEQIGCAFLPAAGERQSVSNIPAVGSNGRYWSGSFVLGGQKSWCVLFSKNYPHIHPSKARSFGLSVRLAQTAD